jgi:predicted RNA binding protein YcfA (HicA-like mRNA interferase family)
MLELDAWVQVRTRVSQGQLGSIPASQDYFAGKPDEDLAPEILNKVLKAGLE